MSEIEITPEEYREIEERIHELEVTFEELKIQKEDVKNKYLEKMVTARDTNTSTSRISLEYSMNMSSVKSEMSDVYSEIQDLRKKRTSMFSSSHARRKFMHLILSLLEIVHRLREESDTEILYDAEISLIVEANQFAKQSKDIGV